LQDEHDLEDRVAAKIALGAEIFHQAFEGQVLIGVGGESGFANLGEQIAKERVAREVGAKGSELMKRPMSFSISRRLRPATGVPTRICS